MPEGLNNKRPTLSRQLLRRASGQEISSRIFSMYFGIGAFDKPLSCRCFPGAQIQHGQILLNLTLIHLPWERIFKYLVPFSSPDYYHLMLSSFLATTTR
jgi:hypothetical protein